MNLINNRQAHIVVIGLGQAGLPLAVLFAKQGYKVTGFEIDKKKVLMINNGKSYHPEDVKDSELRELLESRKLSAETSFSSLNQVNVKIIAVPTLLTKQETPNLCAISKVATELVRHQNKPCLIVLESTVYPGATEEIIKDALDKHNLKIKEDFFLAYSPSRIDPGNKNWPLERVPKIVGGYSKQCLNLATALYKNVVNSVIPASDIKTAEITKIFENSFRAINIAFVDRFKIISQKFGINFWEVVELASSKPYGFMPFYPGPGIGGDCIPIVPYFIAWKVREHGTRASFIELAQEIIDEMPQYIIEQLFNLLNDVSKTMKNSKILLIGAAFKKDVQSTKNSPIIPIVRLLAERGASINYHDPYVEHFSIDNKSFYSKPLTAELIKTQDVVVIITEHTDIDYSLIVENSALIYDTRNVLSKYSSSNIHT